MAGTKLANFDFQFNTVSDITSRCHNLRSRLKKVVAVMLLTMTLGCAQLPYYADVGMRQSLFTRINLDDDLDIKSLEKAAKQNLEYLLKLDQSTVVSFGGKKVSIERMVASVKRLIEIFRKHDDTFQRAQIIRKEFDILLGTGWTNGGNVMVTGYYQPLLNGSMHKNSKYRWPLYKLPPDIVKVDLGQFSNALKGKRIVGHVKEGNLVPYYSREQIDRNGKLLNKDLEAFWIDNPVDVFFCTFKGRES
tara:strand:- start:227750 stop:228493 length:744 start_codon:yes stop_codon:yes gene_type:complete